MKAGNPGNSGGGRPPDWLKAKCRDIVDKKKLVEFLAEVASGENVDFSVTIDGRVIPIPAKPKDRIAATIELLDRGFGKSTQLLGSDPDNPIAPAVVHLPIQDLGHPGQVIPPKDPKNGR